MATPENEEVLLEFARAGSAANMERVVRGWKMLDRKSEVEAEEIRHRTRRFSAFVADDGMVEVRGRLDPEVGAMLMRAIEAASDALYRKEWVGRDEGASAEDSTDRSASAAGANSTEPDAADGIDTAAGLPETTPEQRRADAVGLLAERALAAGFEKGPISGTRAERCQVMLHVNEDTLKEEADPGLSELEDGTRVSAETSRRLGCDATRVMVAHGPEGEVLRAGRRTRTVSLHMRRALEARDRGCRFPGCGLRFTEAHHVKHWADGGETTLTNLVLLCRRHHRAVHEGGVKVCIDLHQQVVFFTPKGKALLAAPPRNPGMEGGRRERVGLAPRPSAYSGASRWKRDSEIPWEVEAAAWEALDSG